MNSILMEESYNDKIISIFGIPDIVLWWSSLSLLIDVVVDDWIWKERRYPSLDAVRRVEESIRSTDTTSPRWIDLCLNNSIPYDYSIDNSIIHSFNDSNLHSIRQIIHFMQTQSLFQGPASNTIITRSTVEKGFIFVQTERNDIT